jgi:hypothetical protein
VRVSAAASWLDRWAERTRAKDPAKDREVIAHQREVDELRTRIPREPVVGPSGVPITVRVERNGIPVGEVLAWRAAAALIEDVKSGRFPTTPATGIAGPIPP